MNAQTHSLGNGARAAADSPVRRQLDMLAGGQMDQAMFLRATIARLHEDPDENWEVLSLLDQYFRLNKISGETFRAVKNGLAEFVLRPRGAAPTQGQPAAQTVQMPPPQSGQAPRAASAQSTRHAPVPVAPARSAQPPPPTLQMPRPQTAPTPPPAVQVPRAQTVQRPRAQTVQVPPTPQPVAPVAERRPDPDEVTQLTVSAWVPLMQAVPPAAPARVARPAAPAAAPAPDPAPATGLETPSIMDRDLVAGDLLRGRYRIEGFLGQGGRGIVYAAADAFRLEGQPQGQRVAVKLLQRSLARRPDAVLELRREFQLLQSLTHPNIVRVHEFDRDGELSFFTMELLDGVLLTRIAQARRQRPLTCAHALALIRDIGAAMSFAHARGVVHGDINPQNIFVTFDGQVRVLDFGAARRTRHAAPYIGEEEAHNSFATVGYASPQVMAGEHAEIRDDIFSLACVAYTLFSGHHPFNEASSLQAQASRRKPKRPRNLKEGPWRALRQALQFDRGKRPHSVAEFLERLDLSRAAPGLPNLNDLLESQSSSRSHIPWAAIAAGVVVLGGATYGYLVHENIVPAPDLGGAPAASTRASGGIPPETEERAPAPAAAALSGTPTPASPEPVSAPPGRPAPVAAPPAARYPESAPTARAPGAARSPAPGPLTAAAPARAGAGTAAPAASGATPRPSAVTDAAPAAATRVATSARVELVADTVDVPATDGTARIVVHRRGPLHGEAPFTWWTESGTAKPGIDFEAQPPHVDRIPDGASSATLSVNLEQTVRAQPKSFYVVIDQTDGGAAVSGRTLTMVTLPGSEH